MPDPFQTLPMPLPLMVLAAIEHLSTLDCLLQASPAAATIFRCHFHEIVEATLQFLVPGLQRLLRTIVLIDSNDIAVRSMLNGSEGTDGFVAEDFLSKTLGLGDRALSRGKSTFWAVRRLVRSAGHVQRLSCLFFDTHLRRLHELRPLSFVHDGKHSYLLDGPNEIPAGQPYLPGRCGPPSFIEEQRVHRALWRLELFRSFLQITETDQTLRRTAHDYYLRGGPPSSGGKPAKWQLDELECVQSFIDSLQASEPPFNIVSSAQERGPTVPQRPPVRNELSRLWMRSDLYVERRSPAASYFCMVLRTLHYSPLFGSSFKPFQYLGFSVWDRKRMVWLGLLHPPPTITLSSETDKDLVEAPEGMLFSQRATTSEIFFRWKSVESQAIGMFVSSEKERQKV